MIRAVAVAALATCCTAVAAFVPAEAAARPAKPFDVNGDGRPDLAVGAPFLQVGQVRAAGGVGVLLASKKGLSTTATFLTQASAGVPGDAEEDDQFGYAVASGDFDRDGYADLAVGQPNETVDGLHAAGGVTVVYGSRAGLDTARSVVITRPGGPLAETAFGGRLVAADFDGDSYADLAVTAGESPTGTGAAGTPAYGVVRILRGSSSGLSSSAGAVLRARTAGGSSDVGFGSELASGDLDRDGVADLVVGARGARAYYDDDDGQIDAVPGAVSVCRGGTALPATCAQVAYGTKLTGLASLAVGNVYGSAAPEIAAGVPAGPDAEDNDDAGSVHVLQLKADLTAASRDLTIRQGSRGVPGTDAKQSEKTDDFGASVALGDIDRDGYADLVVGAPGEDQSRGRVTVVHGARSGYRTSGNTTYDQDTKGIPSSAKPAERFGQALLLDDHDGDGRLDLTIGGDDANKDVGGAVTTLRGSGKAFATKGSRTFGAAALGCPTPRESGFGEVLGG